jgi:hypothetical protein
MRGGEPIKLMAQNPASAMMPQMATPTTAAVNNEMVADTPPPNAPAEWPRGGDPGQGATRPRESPSVGALGV